MDKNALAPPKAGGSSIRIAYGTAGFRSAAVPVAVASGSAFLFAYGGPPAPAELGGGTAAPDLVVAEPRFAGEAADAGFAPTGIEGAFVPAGPDGQPPRRETRRLNDGEGPGVFSFAVGDRFACILFELAPGAAPAAWLRQGRLLFLPFASSSDMEAAKEGLRPAACAAVLKMDVAKVVFPGGEELDLSSAEDRRTYLAALGTGLAIALEALEKQLSFLRDVQSVMDKQLALIQDKLIRCPVTGLYNEGFFDQFLRSESERDPGERTGASMLFLSVDRLEAINEAYGEAVGDEALVACAYTIRAALPSGASLFRLQASTICAYLPGADLGSAIGAAERIRASVAESRAFIEPLSVSIGVVDLREFDGEGAPAAEVAERARAAARTRLLQARKAGGNRLSAGTDAPDSDSSAPLVAVAEPDPLGADILSAAMEAQGYRVLRFGDGEDLWAAVDREEPSLVIAELHLPRLDAFGVRERMLASTRLKDAPFILVSAKKDHDSVQRSAELRIDHYFKKPIFVNEVVAAAALKLGRPR